MRFFMDKIQINYLYYSNGFYNFMNMKKRSFLFALILFINCVSYAQNLKLITYNIRLDWASDGQNAWNNRKDYFCSQLAFYEPDVFGIQEALPN